MQFVMATLLDEHVHGASQPESGQHLCSETLEAEIYDIDDELPLVKNLSSQPELLESPLEDLASGLLLGPGRIEKALAWHKLGKSYSQICYLGSGVCGYLSVAHRGFLTAMLDEAFSRCLSTTFPFQFMTTAHMNIDYKALTFADQFLVIWVNIEETDEGKVRVEGQIETLEDELVKAPTVLVRATALFVEPAAVRRVFYLY